jgi:hypothetical protein
MQVVWNENSGVAWLLIVPLLFQGLAILVDEFYFHHKRGLPRWERWGHPLDTLVSFFCLLFLLFVSFSEKSLLVYFLICLASCFFVTKDERVHTKECGAAENWLHAVLFLMHPLIFVSFGLMWYFDSYEMKLAPWGFHLPFEAVLKGQLVVTGAFGLYQWIYWNYLRPSKKAL